MVAEKKLRCSLAKLDPGGGGINVARAILKLGGSAKAIYPAGGYTGNTFDQLMDEENVPRISIRTKNETRENVIILEKEGNKQFRFGFPGTELFESEWNECLEAIEKEKDVSFIVASGSLPPGVPDDVYARLARIAKKKKAKLVVDTSGEALKNAVSEGVYLLKPNLGELATLVGKEKIEEDEIEALAKKIINDGGAEVMVISMADKGAFLFSKVETFKVVPPKVEIKSTVGAGDSMVAGIVFALSSGASLGQALEYGVASGTAATLQAGTELCSKENTEMLLSKIRDRKDKS
jgi:6-phosphofructokinase 2